MASDAPLVTPVVGENGLPVVSEEEQKKKVAKATKFVAFVMIIPRMLFSAIAFGVYKFTGLNSPFDMSKLGWTYLAIWLLSVLTFLLNFYPMVQKAKLDLKGNIRANMMFFKAIGTAGPMVALEEDGAIGAYNRANRSLFHFNEYLGSCVPCILASGLTFPFPVFVLTAVLFVGRVLHQVGYSFAYGGHAKGFGLSMIAMVSLEGLTLISALSLFGFI
mmetsp:Transcript_56497/g.89717  ORF Transcript_56497/g.89717 Transcript_56497/m.89717 type:complete len:218 (-) Transcript_56497:169-822(-)|eukprot:CAMPEP_0169108268 /NCGR_PEP_ID=MMETSP1015-20121227/25334_1 /TAXON_ID=342587 /ORGANISM="Karlodinium micrum, Strain CCMP2283" /LENGTH=217 /DNA_ID=CAMNT_0009169873 /DNA_START=75 /DNA_END=728 /DNA_ORIENTATION=+